MSHFSVMVITPEKPTAESLAAIMQPWHEFECTGIADQYVIDVDITEESRDDFAKQTTRMVKMADGSLVDAYDHRFYRDPTDEEKLEIGKFGGSGTLKSGLFYASQDWGDGRGYRAKVRFIPEGCEEIEMPYSEIKTFAEFINDWNSIKSVPYGSEPDLEGEHKYGYALLDEAGEVVKVVDRTNPNKKWDWFSVGGRWTGYFKKDYEPETDPENQEVCFLCRGTGKRPDMDVANGCNGCGGKGMRAKWPTDWKNVGNQVQKKDINIEAERDHSGEKAIKRYDELHAIIGDLGLPEPFDTLIEKHGVEKARDMFWEHPGIKAIKEADPDAIWMSANDIDLLRLTRDERLQLGRAKAIVPFAVVKDGTWSERGEMGWWACVSNEKPMGTWEAEFAAMFDTLPPDTWLTIVDCHI